MLQVQGTKTNRPSVNLSGIKHTNAAELAALKIDKRQSFSEEDQPLRPFKRLERTPKSAHRHTIERKT